MHVAQGIRKVVDELADLHLYTAPTQSLHYDRSGELRSVPSHRKVSSPGDVSPERQIYLQRMDICIDFMKQELQALHQDKHLKEQELQAYKYLKEQELQRLRSRIQNLELALWRMEELGQIDEKGSDFFKKEFDETIILLQEEKKRVE